MTPAERLQAAIAALTNFTGEDWHASTYINGVTDIEATNPGGGRRVITDLFLSDDAHLIVTIHRTIDAQLLILQHALARAEAKIAGGGIAHAVWSHERDALTLADAILNRTPVDALLDEHPGLGHHVDRDKLRDHVATLVDRDPEPLTPPALAEGTT